MFCRSSFDDHAGVRLGPAQPVCPNELLRDHLPRPLPAMGPPLLLPPAGKLGHRRSGKHDLQVFFLLGIVNLIVFAS